MILTLPVTILTLGLFLFVINALLFWFVAEVVQGFTVTGFWRGADRLDPLQRDHPAHELAPLQRARNSPADCP